MNRFARIAVMCLALVLLSATPVLAADEGGVAGPGGFSIYLGAAFGAGLIIIGAILVYQQYLARRTDNGRAAPKIFKLNMLIAPVLFLGTLISVWT